MSDTKNDTAWNTLFTRYKILEKVSKEGFCEITSAQINEVREARLMTKFDFRSHLPKIFATNKLSILPISRSAYTISDFETFKDFGTDNPPPIKIDFPNYLESISPEHITSESTALNCAFVTGMIEDFVQDHQIKPTVSGRMSSSDFSFDIQTQKSSLNISVSKSQIEIDGGYEGEKYLSLIEAKNSISNDFLIRQLYYPYRLWAGKITKKVKSVFLTYSNGIFHFREYVLDDPNHYNSLRLKNEKKYVICDSIINVELIRKIVTQTRITPEPSVPFPQADAFERVINLCELLRENGLLTREYITANYDFDPRQTSYYTDAGRYLGLMDKLREARTVNYFLTDLGKRILSLNMTERQIGFIKLILSYQVFNRTIRLYLDKSEPPNNDLIVGIMKTSGLYQVESESTFYRRASTVSRWIDWILEQIEE